ncbi:hypothetical protein BZA05DRAFT_437571 [Tricharina praecox]|uniref:uncharacterized protein n=1 Tax=Tricharina praecox TaxID=43433 RepID=UPI00221F1F01|nr:uncharacterized protein BZA05DRAFT_437571 [Tricharina praecox]KAI5848339.1 hypothetical protein BZA05DRAFT_437571 [Tricharina praecox]
MVRPSVLAGTDMRIAVIERGSIHHDPGCDISQREAEVLTSYDILPNWRNTIVVPAPQAAHPSGHHRLCPSESQQTRTRTRPTHGRPHGSTSRPARWNLSSAHYQSFAPRFRCGPSTRVEVAGALRGRYVHRGGGGGGYGGAPPGGARDAHRSPHRAWRSLGAGGEHRRAQVQGQGEEVYQAGRAAVFSRTPILIIGYHEDGGNVEVEKRDVVKTGWLKKWEVANTEKL